MAQTACMSACKHISHGMQNYLTNNYVKSMTMPSLHQFNLDLVQCERKSHRFALLYILKRLCMEFGVV